MMKVFACGLNYGDNPSPVIFPVDNEGLIQISAHVAEMSIKTHTHSFLNIRFIDQLQTSNFK